MHQSFSSFRILGARLPLPAFVLPPVVLALALVAGCGGGGGGMSPAAMPASSGSGSSASSAATGSAVPLSPYPVPAAPSDHVTFQHDLHRTGLYPSESVLTPANVGASTFGLQRQLMVDSNVDGQPLYLSQLNIGGSPHNVVYAATESDSVYAFDVDSGATLWHVSVVPSGQSPSDERGCSQVTPSIGVTATPVIDRSAGTHGEMFLVAMSKDSSGAYHQMLHALDVTTGAEVSGSPVEITASYTFGSTTSSFDPGQYEERAALTLNNGTLYTAWTSHCDIPPYGGWVMAFSESTLKQTGALNLAASSDTGPAIWMAGDGPAVDSSGNLYVLTGNGGFETTLDSNSFPTGGDYGNSIVKIATAANGTLSVADYFSSSNTVALSSADEDLGSGGELLLPDGVTDAKGVVHQLVVGAGKEHVIYVADVGGAKTMGEFNSVTNNVYQALSNGVIGSVFSTPAYFNGTLYYCSVGDNCRALPLTSGVFGTASSVTSQSFAYPGATPTVSANGTANAIVWAHENTNPAVLHAYDASNLANELYNSSQAPNGRDQFGPGNKFVAPAVADGRVLVGTQNSVAVFGLVTQQPAQSAAQAAAAKRRLATAP